MGAFEENPDGVKPGPGKKSALLWGVIGQGEFLAWLEWGIDQYTSERLSTSCPYRMKVKPGSYHHFLQSQQ